MYEKIPVSSMDKEDWLRLRKTGIGGSDAGALCGANPYVSPMNVFMDKTGNEIKMKGNEAIRQGVDLEDYVAKRFMEETGLKVRRSNYMYRSIEHPFMVADVDRFIVGEDAGLECKTVSAYNEEQWKDGKIPPHYVLQCFHYMAVTGKRTWYIAAVILGRAFAYRRLEWNDELIQGLIRTEEDFWLNHVMTGNLPEPDGSKACDEVLEEQYGKARKDSTIELVGFDEELKRREAILAQIADLEKEQKQIEQKVKLFMKDSEVAANENYRISWSNVETARLDSKRLKKEKPELYSDYTKLSSSRRFQVRAA